MANTSDAIFPVVSPRRCTNFSFAMAPSLLLEQHVALRDPLQRVLPARVDSRGDDHRHHRTHDGVQHLGPRRWFSRSNSRMKTCGCREGQQYLGCSQGCADDEVDEGNSLLLRVGPPGPHHAGDEPQSRLDGGLVHRVQHRLQGFQESIHERPPYRFISMNTAINPDQKRMLPIARKNALRFVARIREIRLVTLSPAGCEALESPLGPGSTWFP